MRAPFLSQILEALSFIRGSSEGASYIDRRSVGWVGASSCSLFASMWGKKLRRLGSPGRGKHRFTIGFEDRLIRQIGGSGVWEGHCKGGIEMVVGVVLWVVLGEDFELVKFTVLASEVLIFMDHDFDSKDKSGSLADCCDISEGNHNQRPRQPTVCSPVIFEVSELSFRQLAPSVDVADFDSWLVFHHFSLIQHVLWS